VRGGHERGVVIAAEPGASLAVVQAEFAFELFVVESDLPAQPGQACEAFWFGVDREVRALRPTRDIGKDAGPDYGADPASAVWASTR